MVSSSFVVVVVFSRKYRFEVKLEFPAGINSLKHVPSDLEIWCGVFCIGSLANDNSLRVPVAISVNRRNICTYVCTSMCVCACVCI